MLERSTAPNTPPLDPDLVTVVVRSEKTESRVDPQEQPILIMIQRLAGQRLCGLFFF